MVLDFSFILTLADEDDLIKPVEISEDETNDLLAAAELFYYLLFSLKKS